jgi:hypothetical protein
MRFVSIASSSILVCSMLNAAETYSDWPQWRGPQRNGHSTENGLPLRWSPTDVVWKTDLPGSGQSTPIVSVGRVFLTAATDGGEKRHVLCLDRERGEILWNRIAWTGEPEETHAMNHYSSATCAADGERVVAFFGMGGIHAYTRDGEHLWSRDLGPFTGAWGTAASPIIVGARVIQNCDAENDASLIALNVETGETVWKTPRDRARGWSTPLLVDTGERREIVLNGNTGVTAYDVETGRQLWFCRGDRGRGTPTVVAHKELVIAVGGRSGDMIAVRTGGRGQVNDTHEVWRTARRGVRDLPSPIVVDRYLIVASYRPGLASCYDVATGKELDRIRLEGNISASPIAVDGLVYLTNEAGKTFVLRPGPKLEIVAQNQLPNTRREIFRATLTPHAGQFLCRSNKVLYCIGE